MTVGNSAIILGLWPLHIVKTYYSILRTKHIGPVLKIVLCICLPVTLILWLVLGIVGSIIGGALYGLLSPIFATFDAVGERKTNMLYHCFYDGTWDTVKGSFTVVRDFGDVCYHSYFSLLDDLRQGAPDVKYYEIRVQVVHHLPGGHRMMENEAEKQIPDDEDSLAILLWPLAVVGAVLGSMVSSIFLGAYAGVVVYQESSFWFGLCYIVASLAIYDEYSNDILDMPEGSCFPRPKYQKDPKLTKATSRAASFSGSTSVRNPLSRGVSFNHPMVDLKPLELLDRIFKECQLHGEIFVSEGLITQQDIDDAKSGKGSRVISIGLPAYCILQALLRSVKANSVGILLSDNVTEITSTNRPKDTFYEWFLNPFLIIKDQIKAENLSEEEEEYLGRLVLLNGDPTKLKSLNTGPPPESERKRAELDALARRLQGITKSVSRYPTSRRNFDHLVKNLSENLAKKNGETKAITAIPRSKSAFARMFSQNSFKKKTSYNGSSDQEAESISARNVEIV
ncbi:hypothetical protein POTOM_060646 [Populus tomentosa]|uniref:Uncharacterized protein n=1 Tax=Populus tomentosa TaxID=118781 RepID=A0A8X8BVS0_POPTO|nr:hypothetical protein POTOM_060646 [Populus tomentosa]